MKYTIELTEQTAQPVLSIRTRTPVEELSGLIGEAYHAIINYLNELGEEPAGAPFTAYFNMDMQNLEVEMGFPVHSSLPGKGKIQSGEIPAGRVISTMYTGPYTGMEAPYIEMAQWITENGHEPVGTSYEYYLNSPEEVPESELVTRIVMPLK